MIITTLLHHITRSCVCRSVQCSAEQYLSGVDGMEWESWWLEPSWCLLRIELPFEASAWLSGWEIICRKAKKVIRKFRFTLHLPVITILFWCRFTTVQSWYLKLHNMKSYETTPVKIHLRLQIPLWLKKHQRPQSLETNCQLMRMPFHSCRWTGKEI